MPEARALIYARHVELRQAQAEAALSETGFDRLLVHSGRSRLRFLDDQAFPFRAHPHFVSWLPLPQVPDCLLEVRPGRKPRLWYCQPEDFWHLPPADPESWWAECFEIERVRDPAGWAGVLETDAATAIIAEDGDLPAAPAAGALNPAGLIRRLDEDRTRKSPWERKRIAAANRAAVAGHVAAEAAFRAGASELEIHLEYLKAAGQDADELPYNSIVALNRHAAVLHYQVRSPSRPDKPLSLLIDAGASSFGYAADVTRTWAGAGQLEFAGLVGALENLQIALAAKARAGQSFPALHAETHLGIAAILEQAGLVRMSPEAMVEAGITRRFLPHGLGHFIGVQVHDVAGRVDPDGGELPPPETDPALRLTRELGPGNVVTIEPGIYFIESLLEPLKAGGLAARIDWKAVDALIPLGGIRIEDNVLVTEGEPVNYTRDAWRLAEAA